MEQAGAAGVQFATRFIATPECDASEAYKEVLLAARPEDVIASTSYGEEVTRGCARPSLAAWIACGPAGGARRPTASHRR